MNMNTIRQGFWNLGKTLFEFAVLFGFAILMAKAFVGMIDDTPIGQQLAANSQVERIARSAP